MAKNFKYINGSAPRVVNRAVKSGTTAITTGDLVTDDGTNAGYAVFAAAITSASTGVGYAISDSTHTASADGEVTVIYDDAGMTLEGAATTPANLARAVVDTKVTLDVSSTTQTVDENDTTSGAIRIVEPTNGNFDIVDGIVRVLVKSNS